MTPENTRTFHAHAPQHAGRGRFLPYLLAAALLLLLTAGKAWGQGLHIRVELESPGTLPHTLAAPRFADITCLEINGTLNGTDIDYLRTNLHGGRTAPFCLDLSDARMGEAYYTYGTRHLHAEQDSVGPYMFAGMEGLTSLVLPAATRHLADGAFYGCTRLDTLVLPPDLISIGRRTFARCTRLQALTLPATVRHIGSEAFYGTALAHVYALSPVPCRADGDSFAPAAENCTLHVPQGGRTAYWLAEGWSAFGQIVEMPATEKERPYWTEKAKRHKQATVRRERHTAP